MIDLHTHILQDTDDGSDDLEMSIKMIQEEIDSGVNDIFLTPHSYYPKNYIREFNKLQTEVEKLNMPIKLYLGCELCVNKNNIDSILEDVDSGYLPTMNNTRCVLVEFFPYEIDYEECKYCISKFIEKSYIPIIAHAERYVRLDFDDLIELKSKGCLIQANVDAALTECDIIDFVGSDCHSLTWRKPDMYRLRNKYKEKYNINAKKYLNIRR